jgi:hypothetical protein
MNTIDRPNAATKRPALWWVPTLMAVCSLLWGSPAAHALPKDPVDPPDVPDDGGGSNDQPLSCMPLPATRAGTSPMPPLPNCPRFDPVGAPPLPAPEVLNPGQILDVLAPVKTAFPTRTTFFVGIKGAQGDGWLVDVDECYGVAANLSVVDVINQGSSAKTVTTWAMGSPATCAEIGRVTAVPAGVTETLYLDMSTTNTLLLTKTVCTFGLGDWCLSDRQQDVAMFTGPEFWTLFGGRHITITWLNS